mgnify:CR=1 FL=1
MVDSLKTTEVELTTGDVIAVGVLDWGGYKKLKPKLVAALAEKAADVMADPAALENAGEAAIAPMLVALDNVLVEMTQEFVQSCVKDKASLKNVKKPVDWLKLRAAAAELNDLKEVLDLEKEALVASVKTLLASMNEVVPGVIEATTTDGGQTSSTS